MTDNHTPTCASKKCNEITFEMATELGLIPKPRWRPFGWFPLMSAEAVRRQDKISETGYRNEMQTLRERHKTVEYHGETLKVI